MKNFVVVALLLFATSIALPNSAQAQNKKQSETKKQFGVGQLVQGLVNVNVGAINVSDITVQDLVDVNNVLNNNQVQVLNRSINRNEVASRNQNLLNNLLRNANLITDNQIIVGVLSGGKFVTQRMGQ